MDIGKAFSFVFEDEEWVSKVLLGGLIALIPLIGQLTVIGYSLKVAQNVAQGNPRPLPTWSEFGDHLMRGLYELVIRLVYALPIIVVAAIFVCAIALAGGATANRRDGSGGALAGTLSICLVPLMVILGLALSVVLYAAVARFVVTNSLGEALRFGEVIALVRRNVAPWAMMLVVALLASFVAGLGLIACGVGVLFTGFYAQCVVGHALGQTIVQQGLAGSPAVPPVAPTSYGPPPSYQ